jgi:hypothetical protein
MGLRATHVFTENGADPALVPHGDRRCRVRVVVHWPLVFRDHAGVISEALTQNLSSQGVYFHADTPCVPGEVLAGTLMVPTHHPEDSTQVIPVSCRLRILRVETLPGNRFGIGCRIEEYHIHALVGDTARPTC